MADELDRCVAFMRALDALKARRREPFPYRTAYFNDDLPQVWELNYLSVDLGAAPTASELAAEAERLHGATGHKHRKVSVGEDGLGTRLAPEFRALGWSTVPLVVKRHDRSVPSVSAVAVEEVAREALDPIWADGVREESWATEEVVRQIVAARAVREGPGNTRYFAAFADARIASYCELFSDGETAQIEGVFTLSPYRGRGLAGAVVVAALAAACSTGHDLAFLLAEERDWPKELYRKLGFETIGRIWDFGGGTAAGT
jgi:GNAT superfamily N-acetyltransferase